MSEIYSSSQTEEQEKAVHHRPVSQPQKTQERIVAPGKAELRERWGYQHPEEAWALDHHSQARTAYQAAA